MIVLPCLLNAVLLLVLNHAWSRAGAIAETSIKRINSVSALTEIFSLVVDYGYSTFANCFDSPDSLYPELVSKGRKFEVMLSSMKASTNSPEAAQILLEVANLKLEVDKLSPTIRHKQFTSNIQRVYTFAKIIVQGIRASIRQEELTDEQINLGKALWKEQAQLYGRVKALVVFGTIIEVILAGVVYIYFSRRVLRRLIMLEENAITLGRLGRRRELLDGNDELTYLDSIFLDVANELTSAAHERSILLRLIVERILSPMNKTHRLFENLRSQMSLPVEPAMQTQIDDWHRSAQVACARIQSFAMHLLASRESSNQPAKHKGSRFSIKDAVQQCCDELSPGLQQKSLHLINACEQGFITANKAQIIQVLMNFITNAIKFSPQNSTILVKSVSTNKSLVVSVIDRGPGVSEQAKSKLFDRYFQSSEEHAAQGFGLGLSICKMLIKSHGGEVGINSTAENGSEFWFSIPNQPERSKELQQQQNTSDGTTFNLERMPKIKSSLFIKGILLIFVPLVGQIMVLLWVNHQVDKAQHLLMQEKKQTELAMTVTSLWVSTFQATSSTGLFLAGTQRGHLEYAVKKLASVGKALNELTALLTPNTEEERLINGLESYVKFENDLIGRSLLDTSINTNDKLGALPTAIRRFQIVNPMLSAFSEQQFKNLSNLVEQQLNLQRSSQSLIFVVLMLNVLTAIALLKGFSAAFTNRINGLVNTAKLLPSRTSTNSSTNGKDEIDHLQSLLAIALSDLAKADQQRESTVDMVAHDIRSPLQTLVVLVGMLSKAEGIEKLGFDPTTLAEAQKGLQDTLDMVNNLLTIGKLKQKQIELMLSDVRFGEILEEAVGDTAERAAVKGITIVLHDSDSNYAALLDKQRIVQLLVNLLNYAIEKATIETDISIDTKYGDNDVTVYVSFEPANSAEQEQKLMPFVKIEDIAQSADINSSLNFAICQLICESHKGYLKSEPGRFEVFLPLSQTFQPEAGPNVG